MDVLPAWQYTGGGDETHVSEKVPSRLHCHARVWKLQDTTERWIAAQ